MTKEELYSILCDCLGCVTCGTVEEINGNNRCYVEFSIDEFIDDSSESYILRDCFYLNNVVKLDPSSIDLDEWGQALPENCVESLKTELKEGNLYKASITNYDSNFEYDLLFWM